MKRWIHASNDLDPEMILKIKEMIKRLKGSWIDEENHVITVVFPKGTTKEDAMEDGMLGAWFRDNGFDYVFEQGDYEYTTQDTWRNYRGWDREKGHKAFLRDRLIGRFTW